MRAISSATISFGLVSIPVKLYSAYDSGSQVRFNQIDKRDGARVKQQLISSKSGEPVPREEIVKGYEFAKGQYVLFTKEELKAIESVSTHTIDIVEFVKAEDVARKYLDRVYFLGAEKGGARAYKLLAEGLRKTGRAAIAKYSSRGKEHLVMLRPEEDGLAMEQLHYHDELRSIADVPMDDAQVKKEELQLALQLIDQAASDNFDATKYKDEVRGRVMEMIDRKVEGEDISVAPTEQAETKIIDIMEALKASLADGKKPAKRAAAKKTARKKTSRKKSS
ncbi:MAG: Ku protein [Gammaproteobacteria bacterium]|nr:Ku protein [Gammaproteobacteria bacterium]NNF61578.1 Ku protein [Gammaproteobacteria bacterium]